ncbi:hypothetical protein [Shewanella surugensis]|uniref:Uncharacterized protein n=1 Tax=Shewanella surugensis TaxID=212020 RepID=A0ABT0LJN4_9GAMM|nr:hypothetical protein [Shewanella surugensis]MCL1127665.1 hypothetical protein [Shewanella surugensis]
MEYLYRGITKTRYQEQGRNLVCQNSAADLTHYYDTIIPHSGIASTSDFKKAKFHALHGGLVKQGYVFKLSIASLDKEDISIFHVSDLVPDYMYSDVDEYVISLLGIENKSDEIVIDVIPVSSC